MSTILDTVRRLVGRRSTISQIPGIVAFRRAPEEDES